MPKTVAPVIGATVFVFLTNWGLAVLTIARSETNSLVGNHPFTGDPFKADARGLAGEGSTAICVLGLAIGDDV